MLDYEMLISTQTLENERALAHRLRLLRLVLPAFGARPMKPAAASLC